jgi:hypothetical protein
VVYNSAVCKKQKYRRGTMAMEGGKGERERVEGGFFLGGGERRRHTCVEEGRCFAKGFQNIGNDRGDSSLVSLHQSDRRGARHAWHEDGCNPSQKRKTQYRRVNSAVSQTKTCACSAARAVQNSRPVSLNMLFPRLPARARERAPGRCLGCMWCGARGRARVRCLSRRRPARGPGAPRPRHAPPGCTHMPLPP